MLYYKYRTRLQILNYHSDFPNKPATKSKLMMFSKLGRNRLLYDCCSEFKYKWLVFEVIIYSFLLNRVEMTLNQFLKLFNPCLIHPFTATQKETEHWFNREKSNSKQRNFLEKLVTKSLFCIAMKWCISLNRCLISLDRVLIISLKRVDHR